MARVFCDSCGRPLGEDDSTKDKTTGYEYCNYCAENGRLKPYEVVKEGLIKFYMEFYNYSRKTAEDYVVNHLKKMPAWENRKEW